MTWILKLSRMMILAVDKIIIMCMMRWKMIFKNIDNYFNIFGKIILIVISLSFSLMFSCKNKVVDEGFTDLLTFEIDSNFWKFTESIEVDFNDDSLIVVSYSVDLGEDRKDYIRLNRKVRRLKATNESSSSLIQDKINDLMDSLNYCQDQLQKIDGYSDEIIKSNVLPINIDLNNRSDFKLNKLAREVSRLTRPEVVRLVNILKYPDAEGDYAEIEGCYFPRDAILFISKNDYKVKAFIEVSINSCPSAMFYPEIPMNITGHKVDILTLLLYNKGHYSKFAEL